MHEPATTKNIVAAFYDFEETDGITYKITMHDSFFSIYAFPISFLYAYWFRAKAQLLFKLF